MPIFAYGFQLTKAHEELIDKLLEFIAPEEEKKIIDLQNYDIQPDKYTVVVTFGTLAKNRINRDSPWRLELGEPAQLLPYSTNKTTRESTYKLCTLFKERIASRPLLLTKEDIPSEEGNDKEWSFTTKDNKKIVVSDGPQSINSDLVISFQEMYILTTLINKLGISTIEIKGK